MTMTRSITHGQRAFWAGSTWEWELGPAARAETGTPQPQFRAES